VSGVAIARGMKEACRLRMPGYGDLLRRSRFPNDLRTMAFAGVIAQALATSRRPLIRGMSEDAFQRLLRSCFPGIWLWNGQDVEEKNDGVDEFDDLLGLLLDSRAHASEANAWLSCCIASAAMNERHLWQDMGLPNREQLSRLLGEYFPALAAANVGDMKWKKFFYRQLCQRAGLMLCKSPHCADCTDYRVCFGPETAASPAGALGYFC